MLYNVIKSYNTINMLSQENEKDKTFFVRVTFLFNHFYCNDGVILLDYLLKLLMCQAKKTRKIKHFFVLITLSNHLNLYLLRLR
jgi:hypothetical protein